jgi:two-component system, NtrC family, sensor histidine kinase GlrK
MYPKSFFKLLLFGFALAMLPLLFAFGNASIHVDRLAEQSRNTIARAVQATRSSRVLVEQLSQMERSARQYFVLHDDSFLENFTTTHNKFLLHLQELENLPITKEQSQQLKKMGVDEVALFNEIHQKKTEEVLPETITSQFNNLSEQAQRILSDNNQLIDRESTALAKLAERTQNVLFWQSLTLLPVGLVVALAITYLVAQPIRHMDAAIKHLGEGHYHDAISIEGPNDIRILGERLDWLRSQLQHVEQEKQRFLRHVSHELKTPLTAIREGTELLSDEVGGTLTEQQKEITQILRESSVRLQKMIENLLHYTAVQFKKPELKLSKVSLVEVMQNVIKLYALSIENKQIKILSSFEDVHVVCDQEKVHTIIDNLISNAIKYTPQAGMINLRIYLRRDHAIIKVLDNGPGIPTSDHAKLFDPFYRGQRVHEGLVSGSGLGLSIAKEYVDAHGGMISLIPTNTGAHFRVQLPLDASKQEDETNIEKS